MNVKKFVLLVKIILKTEKNAVVEDYLETALKYLDSLETEGVDATVPDISGKS